MMEEASFVIEWVPLTTDFSCFKNGLQLIFVLGIFTFKKSEGQDWLWQICWEAQTNVI